MVAASPEPPFPVPAAASPPDRPPLEPGPSPEPRPEGEPPPRSHLQQVAGSVSPVVRAADRVLPVAGPAGALLPGGGLRRGSVLEVRGAPGAGATSASLGLAAAAGSAGEWAVVVELAGGPGGGRPARGEVGGLAALEAGADLDRFAVVRGVTRQRWGAVVAALLDCGGVVLVETPRGLRPAAAERLAARARRQGAVLVALGEWPAGASRRLRATGREAAAASASGGGGGDSGGGDGDDGGGGGLIPGALRLEIAEPGDVRVAGGAQRRVAVAG